MGTDGFPKSHGSGNDHHPVPEKPLPVPSPNQNTSTAPRDTIPMTGEINNQPLTSSRTPIADLYTTTTNNVRRSSIERRSTSPENVYNGAQGGPGSSTSLSSTLVATGPNLSGHVEQSNQSAQEESTSSPYPSSVHGSPRQPRFEPVEPQRHVSYFYDRDKPLYELTNFSPYTVTYNEKIYPTSEHLFQAMKFMERRPGLAEHIRTYSDRPRVAFEEARRFEPEWRPDWHIVKVDKMDEVLRLKFTQHARLSQLLLGTKNDILVEDSPFDAFWGNGADKKGRNELGQALERTRSWLQDQHL